MMEKKGFAVEGEIRERSKKQVKKLKEERSYIDEGKRESTILRSETPPPPADEPLQTEARSRFK
jgi:hypothetical protein